MALMGNHYFKMIFDLQPPNTGKRRRRRREVKNALPEEEESEEKDDIDYYQLEEEEEEGRASGTFAIGTQYYFSDFGFSFVCC
jgi:hypothetical protein